MSLWIKNPEKIDLEKNSAQILQYFPPPVYSYCLRSQHSVLNYTLYVRLQFYENEFNSLQNLLLFLFVIKEINKIFTLDFILFAMLKSTV